MADWKEVVNQANLSSKNIETEEQRESRLSFYRTHIQTYLWSNIKSYFIHRNKLGDDYTLINLYTRHDHNRPDNLNAEFNFYRKYNVPPQFANKIYDDGISGMQPDAKFCIFLEFRTNVVNLTYSFAYKKQGLFKMYYQGDVCKTQKQFKIEWQQELSRPDEIITEVITLIETFENSDPFKPV